MFSFLYITHEVEYKIPKIWYTVTDKSVQEISTLKVKVKTFSLIDIKPKFVQICTICTTSSQNFLGKEPNSLFPLPKHILISYPYIQHKLKLLREKKEQQSTLYIAKSGDILFLYEKEIIETVMSRTASYNP